MGFISRIQHAWNAFMDNKEVPFDYGYSSSRPMHRVVTSYNSSNFVATIYNRIAMDVSLIKVKHVKVDEKTEDVETIKSGLNYCLSTEANIDQTGIQFMQDLVYSMFDEGVVAVVPVETSKSPSITEAYEFHSLRVGKIVQWFPEHVRINLYNEVLGQNQDIILPKKMVAIVENPLYAVVNGENSILRQLTQKIALLDNFEIMSSSGRLDLVIQVPYGIKTNLQKAMAEKRIRDIEAQLATNRHGITYMDSTEKITQLNRPIETQLPATIERLTKQFYNQLGLTQAIFDGTATESELRIYYSRTIDPIVENIIAEFTRKFLTKTARAQGHQIQYYRDMFRFVTVEMVSGFADSVRRNSVLTSNEVRKILGHRVSNDPRADELFNPNIADKNQNQVPSPEPNSPNPPDPGVLEQT